MKKMMVALVGIVSVLMLASCEKVVEIDGDVSIAKTNYSYRMEVTGTASYIPAEWDSTAKKWVAEEGAKSVELVANEGWLSWNDSVNTNQKSYDINTWYKGDTEKEVLYLSSFDLDTLVEYKGAFYLDDVDPENKVNVTGSPEDNNFSVKVSNFPVARYYYIENDRYSEDFLLTFDLTFSR